MCNCIWPPKPRSLTGHYIRRYESLVPQFYTAQRSVREDRLGATTQPVISAVTRICSVGLMSKYRTSCHRTVSFLSRAKATAVPFFRTQTDRLTYFILRNITIALEKTLIKELLATLDILHSSSGRLLSPAATNLTACYNHFFRFCS
jgi:hypothetical protein